MSENSNTYNREYILMLPRWYPNVKDKADGNFIEKHIKCISKKIPVKVLFVKGLEYVSPENSLNSISLDSYEHHILYFQLYRGLFKSLINPILFFLKQLQGYRIIRNKNGPPALSHVHVMARTTLLAYYLRYFKRIPFVISEHWSGYYPESGKLSHFKKILYRNLIKGAVELTAVSKSLGNAIGAIGVNKHITIIPNVVDQIFYNSKFSETKPEIKRLIHISNLITDIKQTDKIMLYLNELAEKRNDFELWIVGDGADKTALEHQSEEMYNLKNKIHFKGNVNRETLAGYLSGATATLSYSKFETQSIVLLESIAMGIPIVAPNVGGIPEHCRDKGILFNVNDKDQFMAGIEMVLNDEYDVNSLNWKEYVKENFSSEAVSRKFVDLYTKIKPSLNVQ